MNNQTVYVLLMADELVPGSYAPIDVCQGIFVDATAARDKADDIVEASGAEFPEFFGWQPDPAIMGDVAKLVCLREEREEVFAVIERIELERRAPGDRRGSGR